MTAFEISAQFNGRVETFRTSCPGSISNAISFWLIDEQTSEVDALEKLVKDLEVQAKTLSEGVAKKRSYLSELRTYQLASLAEHKRAEAALNKIHSSAEDAYVSRRKIKAADKKYASKMVLQKKLTDDAHNQHILQTVALNSSVKSFYTESLPFLLSELENDVVGWTLSKLQSTVSMAMKSFLAAKEVIARSWENVSTATLKCNVDDNVSAHVTILQAKTTYIPPVQKWCSCNVCNTDYGQLVTSDLASPALSNELHMLVSDLTSLDVVLDKTKRHIDAMYLVLEETQDERDENALLMRNKLAELHITEQSHIERRAGLTARIDFLRSANVVEQVEPELSHIMVWRNYTRPTFCGYCSKLLTGVIKQGLRCKGCKYDIHEKCIPKIDKSCLGKNARVEDISCTGEEVSSHRLVDGKKDSEDVDGCATWSNDEWSDNDDIYEEILNPPVPKRNTESKKIPIKKTISIPVNDSKIEQNSDCLYETSETSPNLVVEDKNVEPNNDADCMYEVTDTSLKLVEEGKNVEPNNDDDDCLYEVTDTSAKFIEEDNNIESNNDDDCLYEDTDSSVKLEEKDKNIEQNNNDDDDCLYEVTDNTVKPSRPKSVHAVLRANCELSTIISKRHSSTGSRGQLDDTSSRPPLPSPIAGVSSSSKPRPVSAIIMRNTLRGPLPKPPPIDHPILDEENYFDPDMARTILPKKKVAAALPIDVIKHSLPNPEVSGKQSTAKTVKPCQDEYIDLENFSKTSNHYWDVSSSAIPVVPKTSAEKFSALYDAASAEVAKEISIGDVHEDSKSSLKTKHTYLPAKAKAKVSDELIYDDPSTTFNSTATSSEEKDELLYVDPNPQVRPTLPTPPVSSQVNVNVSKKKGFFSKRPHSRKKSVLMNSSSASRLDAY